MTAAELAAAMQRAGLLEDQVPPAAERWIATFLDAYGASCATIEDALHDVALLRAEATTIPALELERLRNRQVVFFLDAVWRSTSTRNRSCANYRPDSRRYPGHRR